jgi:hypothetical protein
MASKGWTWTWQRCGRYKYQKLLVHTTNPDHLAASAPSLTDIPPLRAAERVRGRAPARAVMIGGITVKLAGRG